MSVSRDEESKLKYKELKDCRCQYAETKQVKQNVELKYCRCQYAETRHAM